MQILVINSGSSSIKFSIYETSARDDTGARDGANIRCVLEGELSGVGGAEATLQVGGGAEKTVEARSVKDAIRVVFNAVDSAGERASGKAIEAAGYRVVHPGPKLKGHQRITEEVLKDLEEAKEFAPLHDPEAIEVIREGMKRLPEVTHYACFDTVFHDTMPEEAKTYPLPVEYAARGVRRYGFHGLSCESIMRQMRSGSGEMPARMVIAHLGSGCSVTAVLDGCSLDTTMGLTPTGGVVMGTRPGDLDPGLVLYLLRQEKGDNAAAAVERLLNHKSGMAGLSGLANDMKAMRKAAAEGDTRSMLALQVFTRSVTKAIGGFCWLMGGVDAIVFAGGIGEHDAATRREVLAQNEGRGIFMDDSLNGSNERGVRRISTSTSKTAVFVVPAQEDLMIALHVERMARAGR